MTLDMIAECLEEEASTIRGISDKAELAKIKSGEEKVVDFSLGNPILEPPPEFFEQLNKLSKNMKPGQHRYMPSVGYLHTREAVANNLMKNGFFNDIKADHIFMTHGAAGALNIVLRAILQRGDEAIILAPYFGEYRNYIKFHNGKESIVTCKNDFNLDLVALEKSITPKTKAVIINSPNNPSGIIYPRSDLEELVKILSKKEKSFQKAIYLISDEPYRRILFNGNTFTSPTSLYENSFMIYSWSKELSIAGERIGYGAANPLMKDLNGIISRLNFASRVLYVNASALMQNMIPDLLDLELDFSLYKENCDKIVQCLEANGFNYVKPQGTFYITVKCPKNRNGDPVVEEMEFINNLADNYLFFVVPGKTFGALGWFRISYSTSLQTVNLACKILPKIAAEYNLKPNTLSEGKNINPQNSTLFT